jgi:hypothetical protein
MAKLKFVQDMSYKNITKEYTIVIRITFEGKFKKETTKISILEKSFRDEKFDNLEDGAILKDFPVIGMKKYILYEIKQC